LVSYVSEKPTARGATDPAGVGGYGPGRGRSPGLLIPAVIAAGSGRSPQVDRKHNAHTRRPHSFAGAAGTYLECINSGTRHC
jgi:hypothetical protein